MSPLLKTYAKEHPTLLLSICYFLVTLIGVIYSHFFYREFGIAILKFADLSDFLLASILEPLSVVIFVSWLAFYFVAYKVELWLRKRFDGYGRAIEKTLKPKYSDPIFFIFFMTVLTITFVRNLAITNADEVKSGEIDSYIILVPSVDAEDKEHKVALIGSSSRFSYFYDAKTKEAKVVPVESISYMRKLLTKDSKSVVDESQRPPNNERTPTSTNE